ncbi:MAG: VWA domain-containing protein [Gallionellaceae bacterium]|nr:VWA domain-containing protein [Gallionellaceae bacterium]
MIDFLTNLEWRAPWWGLLVLQPLLFWALARRRRQRLAGYADAHLLPWAVTAAPRERGAAWRAAANGLAWLLLAAAAAGPRLPLETAPGQDAPASRHHAISVMVLLDVSTSMAATDIAPTRLTRAKLELSDWLGRLSGERVGLIVYSGAAGVLLPLTDDPALFRRALEQADAGLIEQAGTHLGAALDLAARQLQGAPTRGKAILLISDGEADSLARPAGEAVRAAAARLAKQGIPLFVLGVGTQTGAAIPLPEGGYAERDGAQVQSRLDAAAYADLARLAGGRYATVADGDADWVELHDHGLATLPGDPPAAAQARAWRELYPWLLAPAWALLLSGFAGRTGRVTAKDESGGQNPPFPKGGRGDLATLAVMQPWDKSPPTPLWERGEQERLPDGSAQGDGHA